MQWRFTMWEYFFRDYYPVPILEINPKCQLRTWQHRLAQWSTCSGSNGVLEISSCIICYFFQSWSRIVFLRNSPANSSLSGSHQYDHCLILYSEDYLNFHHSMYLTDINHLLITVKYCSISEGYSIVFLGTSLLNEMGW